jgi:outer membrane protein OmpA-like peptidoglycan-associated protein
MKALVCVGLLALNAGLVVAIGAEDNHRVNVSVTAGAINYEGDEAVRDSLLVALHVGVDWTEHWTLEGVLSVFPKLDENYANSYGTRVSRLRAAAGQDVHSTRAFGVAVDALYHFTRWERFDPYLCVGLGVMRYADDFDTQAEPVLRTGGGWLYHLSDRLSLRADLRVLCAGPDTEVNALAGGGVMWTFGGPVAATAATGALDTDGDGLVDEAETQAGTNPFKADTDGDGLTDGEELRTYHTDPLNRDTDYDGLTDGAEIHTHRTNPLLRDTDQGRVADGHEVIEDATDPLAADDDLLFFELNMQFTGDGWEIRPEYFSDLDAIAAVLRDNPQATARIEGHTDRRANLSAWRTRRLTRRRAGAIAGYLERNWKIDGGRLESVGYGFDRPKARDEAGQGNALNRRMEIYIRTQAR